MVTKVGILSPVAEAIQRPDPRPVSGRLKSLRGAKIVFVDNSLESTKVLHDELKRLLLKRGIEPVSVVKTYWRQLDPAVIAELAERSDAVISGVSTTPPSTTWGTVDSIGFERRGRPTVTLVAAFYEDLLRETAAGEGMIDLRHVVLPYPIEGLPEETVRAIARSVFERVVAALTS